MLNQLVENIEGPASVLPIVFSLALLDESPKKRDRRLDRPWVAPPSDRGFGGALLELRDCEEQLGGDRVKLARRVEHLQTQVKLVAVDGDSKEDLNDGLVASEAIAG